jgi:mono/diheme cytochrome c family protein
MTRAHSPLAHLLILASLLTAWPIQGQMLIKGTSEAGRRLFHSPAISNNGLSCGHCHADFDETKRSDGIIRAAHSLYNAFYRETWWGMDLESPLAYATIDEAALVCVVQYMRNKTKLTAQQSRDLRAYLKSLSFKLIRIAQPIAPAADKTGEYTGFAGGNRFDGKSVFYAACHSCHPNGNAGIALKPLPRDQDPSYYTRYIREGDGLGSVLSGVDPNAYQFKAGRFMPFFGADRLSDAQIRDIIAYIKSLPPAP